MNRAQKISIFIQGASLYLLAGCLTILGGVRILPLVDFIDLETSPAGKVTNLVFLFFAIFFILFLLFKFRWLQIFVRLGFFGALFIGLFLFLNIFMSLFWALTAAAYSLALYFLLGRPIIHNLIVLLSLTGLALFFGIKAPPFVIFILLLIFSLYDIIAVFGTKHMIKMAKGFFKLGLLPGFILATDPHLLVFNKKVKPGAQFSFLGSGDLVLPLIFVASLVNFNIFYAVGAALGNILGFAIIVFLLWGAKRRPLPALPPIVLGEIAGLIITYMVSSIF